MAKGKFKKELRKISEERDKQQAELMPNLNKEFRSVNTYKGTLKRGDIFYFDKGYTVGVEQQGGRPGIIVSNDKCNNSSDFLLVVYMTTEPKTDLPTHVKIASPDGRSSLALCEQIHTLSKCKMQSYVGCVSEEEMSAINEALLTTLGINLDAVSIGDYSELVCKINSLAEENDTLTTEKRTLEIRIENLLKTKEMLEHQLETQKPIENSEELIKITIERDTYEKLYNNLIKALLKE